jgi:hypothetical protein
MHAATTMKVKMRVLLESCNRALLDSPRIRRANRDPCHQHEHEGVNVPNRDEVSDGRSPMLDEKKKGNDSDDDGNDLPDVRIQAPYVTQKSQQASACDHERES